MYEAFYSLRARPFGTGVGACECWLTSDVDQSLQHAIASLQNGTAAVLVSGPRGSGRTTICRELAQRLSPALQPICLAHCEFANPLDLWRTILFELGRDFASLTAEDARLTVLSAARELRPERDGLLVIADDADSLSDALLDELRRLTVQRHEVQPLVQLVLCGTYALEERLANPELSAVAERIGRHIVLESLTREQSRNYIKYRLESAGRRVDEVFSDAAIEAIIAAGDGNLQCLNQLCDHALLLGFANEERPVTDATIDAALEDLKGLSLPWNMPAMAHPDDVVPLCDDGRILSDSGPEVAIQHVETAADDTRVHVATGDDTRMEFSGDESCQSWWDNYGDAAAIEIGAEQPASGISVSAVGQASLTSIKNPSMMDAHPPVNRDDPEPNVRESMVEDRYAALDRLAEADGGSGIDLSHLPTGTTFVCEPVAEPASLDADDRYAEAEAEPPRVSNGIETRLLLDVTALRNELRAEAETTMSANMPPISERVREMAPTDPQWDIVEPEPDRAAGSRASGEIAVDDAHKPTEPMIDVDGMQSGEGDSMSMSADGPEQRRYARLFTRLKERRASTASESTARSLRLWR